MKIIEIEVCAECPYIKDGRFCLAERRMLKYQGRYVEPPEWCPLEDDAVIAMQDYDVLEKPNKG